jgi:hypothetical protein
LLGGYPAPLFLGRGKAPGFGQLSLAFLLVLG